jgi:superfamily II DNA or RNA helicase
MYPGKNNIRGDIIKVLLTTKSGAEGIDLQNVRQVHIVEPYWNPVRTEQVKGRAVRVGSHLQLPPKDRTVEIYTYLSTIKIEDLKTDLTILDDKGGMTSDQVLFEISQKKLEVMNDFLRLIKETSFDCNINLNETRSADNYFECLTYGTASRNDYSFGPNVRKEHVDTERKRRVKVSSIEYVFKKIKMMGKSVTFAVLLSELPDGPNILYDAEMAKVGDAGEPLGEYVGEATKLKPYDIKRLKDYIKSF